MEGLALLALVLLACPLMMWFMMRGMRGDNQVSAQHQDAARTDAEIASLRAELDQLRAAQRDAGRERS